MIFQKRTVGLSEGSLNRFVLQARRAARLRGRVNVVVTGSNTMRALNLRFRGYNKATDVLSFPAQHPAGGNSKSSLAGEIVISADIAARNAIEFGHSPAAEVKILALHGILHLAGLDHERDNGEMARKEANLRRVLKLPANLIERAQTAASFKGRTDGSRLRRSRRTA